MEEKCGPPKSKQVIGKKKFKGKYQEETYLIEEWIYELRYGWVDVLTFTGGRLSDIDSLQK